MEIPSDAPVSPNDRTLRRSLSRTSTSAWVDQVGNLKQRDEVDAWNYVVDDPRFALTSWFSEEAETLYTQVAFTMDCGGPPQRVHGGCVGTVMDTVLAHLGWKLNCRPTYTKDFTVQYKGATPLGSTCWAVAWCKSRTGRHNVLAAKLMKDGQVLVEAEGTFIAQKTSAGEADLKMMEEQNQAAMFKALELEIPRDLPERTSLDGVPGMDWPENDPEYQQILTEKEAQPYVDSKVHRFTKPNGQRSFDCHADGRAKVPVRYFHVPGSFAGLFWFSPYAQGPHGIVHGGAIFTAFDCLMGNGTRELASWSCVTKWLRVRYIKAVPVNSVVRIQVTSLERSKAGRENFIKASMTMGGEVVCEAEAVFIRTMKRDFTQAAALEAFGSQVPRDIAEKNYHRIFGGSAMAVKPGSTFEEDSMASASRRSSSAVGLSPSPVAKL